MLAAVALHLKGSEKRFVSAGSLINEFPLKGRSLSLSILAGTRKGIGLEKNGRSCSRSLCLLCFALEASPIPNAPSGSALHCPSTSLCLALSLSPPLPLRLRHPGGCQWLCQWPITVPWLPEHRAYTSRLAEGLLGFSGSLSLASGRKRGTA